MSLVSAIRRMRAAGLSEEQALIAAEVIESEAAAKSEAIAEARREKERDKKRAQRAKAVPAVPDCPGDIEGHPGTLGTSGDIEGQEAASRVGNNYPHAQTVIPAVSSLRSETELVTPLPSGGPQGGRSRSRGAALPEDWTPSEELFAYAAEQGLTRAQAEQTFEDMRLWADANRNRPVARKADWTATAKGFLRRDAAKNRDRKARAGPAYRDNRNGWGEIAAELFGGTNGRPEENHNKTDGLLSIGRDFIEGNRLSHDGGDHRNDGFVLDGDPF